MVSPAVVKPLQSYKRRLTDTRLPVETVGKPMRRTDKQILPKTDQTFTVCPCYLDMSAAYDVGKK